MKNKIDFLRVSDFCCTSSQFYPPPLPRQIILLKFSPTRFPLQVILINPTLILPGIIFAIYTYIYATHETSRREIPIHLRFSRKICHGPPFPAERGGGREVAIYLALFFISPSPLRGTSSPRGKTSGTEFKFHKLVRPLHPRRNRDRLISSLPLSLSLGDLNVFPSSRRTPRGGRFLESVGALSARPANQPAGQDHDLDAHKS